MLSNDIEFHYFFSGRIVISLNNTIIAKKKTEDSISVVEALKAYSAFMLGEFKSDKFDYYK